MLMVHLCSILCTKSRRCERLLHIFIHTNIWCFHSSTQHLEKKNIQCVCICTFKMLKFQTIWNYDWKVILSIPIFSLTSAYEWICAWFIHLYITLRQFHALHLTIVTLHPTHFDGTVNRSIPQYVCASSEGCCRIFPSYRKFFPWDLPRPKLDYKYTKTWLLYI